MSGVLVKEGQILAGKYRVEAVLGEGGMGVVVAAWHEELEKRVAMKFLRREMAERSDAAERFRREARAAVRIQSEHVARVLDVGTMEEGVPYMVMEFLEGHDLSDELSQRGQLPVEEAVDYVLQASEAIAEAHASGIVHRDLKPANLFLTRRADGTRLVKVLDFGISKSLVGTSMSELSLTRTASMIGSPLYMSPEQMKSAKTVDTRTDIWAIGAILYEMLAAQPPYQADSMPELCAKLLDESPPPMSSFRNDVPAELEEALFRCLEKDRTRRWATVADLAQALVEFGPLESRIHATRASRVLGSTDISVTALSASSSGRQEAARPVAAASSVDEKARTLSVRGSTQHTWGRTDPPGSAVAPPQRPRWLLPVGALVLVLGSVGVLLLVRSPSATASAGAASAGLVASDSADAPSPPSAAATAVSPPVAASAESAAADAGAQPPPAPPAPSAAAKAVSPPHVVSRPPPRPVPKKPGSGVIPEFGGRR